MKHDQFVEDVGSAYSFAQSHRRNIVVAIVAGVVLLAAGWGYYVWRQHQEDAAQDQLAAAIEIMDTAVAGTPGAQNATKTLPSEAAKFTQAEPLLKAVVSKYGSSDAADVAELYLARISAGRGDTAGATSLLQGFLRDHPGSILAGPAQLSLYQLQLHGEAAKALIPELEQKVSQDTAVLPRDAMLSLLGQAYEVTGQETRARDSWRRIVNEFPDSPYVVDAQRKLAAG
ncbi:MAG: tetratricopeptide repeat protein [Acidobacteriota bacterium]